MCLPRCQTSMCWCVCLVFVLQAVIPPVALAQFGGLKKKAMQLAFCGGGAYGGFKLGERLAEIEAKKLKLGAEEAAKHRRAFQVGMAVALCATSAYLSGTVYEKLSKRDREAREREMQLALGDANPTTRAYVLPDSKYEGKIATEGVELDGDRECKITVDVLSKDGEPARARFCRKPPTGDYELDT
jgi:hypothetical protein